MGEIRIVGPGKTRGYPYPICKKFPSCHGLRQLTRVFKSDVRIVKFRSKSLMRSQVKLQMTFGKVRHAT